MCNTKSRSFADTGRPRSWGRDKQRQAQDSGGPSTALRAKQAVPRLRSAQAAHHMDFRRRSIEIIGLHRAKKTRRSRLIPQARRSRERLSPRPREPSCSVDLGATPAVPLRRKTGGAQRAGVDRRKSDTSPLELGFALSA